MSGQVSARRGNPWRAPGGFTLIELLVVIAIIAVLVGLLLPGLGALMERNREMVCQSNLRQLTNAAFNYYADTGAFPLSLNVPKAWANGITSIEQVTNGTLWPYVKDLGPYKCPTFCLMVRNLPGYGKNTVRSYSLNGMTSSSKFRLSNVPRPSTTVMFAEENPTAPTYVDGVQMNDTALNNGSLDPPRDCPATFHSNSSCMVSYFDGHTGRFIMDRDKVWVTHFRW